MIQYIITYIKRNNMSTALDYMEKTATIHGFNATAFTKFQKNLLAQKDDAAKIAKKTAKSFNKGMKKNKQKMKDLESSNTKKSILFGGGAGVATGVASGNVSTSKNDEL